MRTNYLTTDTGIPSLPVVNNVTVGSGVVTLLIQVSYSGVINSDDFNFIISIYNENDHLFDTQTINPDSQYFTGSMINAVITVNLEEGMYSLTVQSSNPYGMSEVTELTDEVIVGPVTSITTTISTKPTSTTTSSVSMTTTSSTSGTVLPTCVGGSSGLNSGTVAGIVIGVTLINIVVSVIVILIVISILYKKKETTGRVYFNTNEAYDVVKDTTREEVPLQSIHLEHNLAYGEIKPSIKQQPVSVVYDTPLLMPQQQQK